MVQHHVARVGTIASARAARRSSTGSYLFERNRVFNLPDESDRVFEQVLGEKKGRLAGGGDHWQARLCTLTRQKLVLSKPGLGQALDVIPLQEILEVSHVEFKSIRESDSDIYRMEERTLDHVNAFYVQTKEAGLCAGRNYCFKAEDDASCQEWVLRLNKAAHLAQKAAERSSYESKLGYVRKRCRNIYESKPSQMMFGAVIVAAFLVSVVSTEMQPEEGSEAFHIFSVLHTIFTTVFTVELAFNMFGSWFTDFVSEPWNLVDSGVVLISILAEFFEGFPAFSVLRLIRVFRVVRLFRWMSSLRQILIALMAAVTPVLNSFLILLLVTCIYALLATEFFKGISEEYFGSFSLSLLTMFQVATGDGWASIVGRSLTTEEGRLNIWAVLFLVSYVLLVGLVLINIVIAVLLDEFLSTVSQEKEAARQEEQDRMRMHMGIVQSPLEPLLESISSFFSNEDLSARIQYIFNILDTNGNRSLSCAELNYGLRKLDFHPPIHLSADDFEVLTEGQRLCNDNGELDPTTFEVMMRSQLQQFVQMQAATTLVSADSVSKSLLLVLKQMALTLELLSPVSNTDPSESEELRPSLHENTGRESAERGRGEVQMEQPHSFYVSHGLGGSVKLPLGLGFGRVTSNPGASQASLASFWDSRLVRTGRRRLSRSEVRLEANSATGSPIAAAKPPQLCRARSLDAIAASLSSPCASHAQPLSTLMQLQSLHSQVVDKDTKPSSHAKVSTHSLRGCAVHEDKDKGEDPALLVTIAADSLAEDPVDAIVPAHTRGKPGCGTGSSSFIAGGTVRRSLPPAPCVCDGVHVSPVAAAQLDECNLTADLNNESIAPPRLLPSASSPTETSSETAGEAADHEEVFKVQEDFDELAIIVPGLRCCGAREASQPNGTERTPSVDAPAADVSDASANRTRVVSAGAEGRHRASTHHALSDNRDDALRDARPRGEHVCIAVARPAHATARTLLSRMSRASTVRVEHSERPPERCGAEGGSQLRTKSGSVGSSAVGLAPPADDIRCGTSEHRHLPPRPPSL